jgi:hypothetical protein
MRDKPMLNNPYLIWWCRHSGMVCLDNFWPFRQLYLHFVFGGFCSKSMRQKGKDKKSTPKFDVKRTSIFLLDFYPFVIEIF